MLGFTLLSGALLQAFRLAQASGGMQTGGWGDQVLLASGLLVVACALVMVYIGLLLTCERTETNLRITQRQLRLLADTDPLTGVPNRRHFHERASQALTHKDAVPAALLPGTSVSDAMTVASRIVARLEHRQVAPRVAPLSLSFGIVEMKAGETLADGLRRADQALYEAKRQGRSRAVAASGVEDKPVFGESRRLGLSAP